jgi:hypothetical protein
VISVFVCTTIIKPLVVGGCGTWAMTEQMKSSLRTWVRETVRKIYSPIEDENGWRIQITDELQVMHRKPNAVTSTKLRSLEWAGCLVRMSDGRVVKKVFLGKPGGRTNAGRPKLRWLDCTENDLKSVGVKEMEEESR